MCTLVAISLKVLLYVAVFLATCNADARQPARQLAAYMKRSLFRKDSRQRSVASCEKNARLKRFKMDRPFALHILGTGDPSKQ